MCVEDDRPGNQAGKRRDRGQGEKSESPSIVGIVYRVLAVNTVAIEVI
jgi:hypothetical protein